MTITPTAVAPAVVPAGAPDAGTAAGATVPGTFLALVQQALADALGGAPDSAAGATGATASAPGRSAPGTSVPGLAAVPGASAGPHGGGTGADSATDGAADPATDLGGADPALAAAAAGLTALVGPVAPLPTPPVTGSGPAGASVGPAAAASPSTPAQGSARTGATAKAEPAHKATSDAPSVEVATTPDLPSGSAATGDSGQASGQQADPGTSRQSDAPAPSSVVPATPAAAPAAVAPVAHGHVTTSTPVSGQVFPEVTSLVSRGDGTHRITLSLKPEALGEVRVVMTVRDGAVHVRLAAGHEAQQALLEGSSELSRLLERAGASETRIAVRDLSGATAPTTGGSGTGTGPDLGQGEGLGAGSNRSQDQHAGTRAEHEATEGRHHTTTTGATEPRGVQTVTRTRSGVDVTM